MKLIESQARLFMTFFKRNFDVLNESAQKKIKTSLVVFDIVLILILLAIIL